MHGNYEVIWQLGHGFTICLYLDASVVVLFLFLSTAMKGKQGNLRIGNLDIQL